MLDRETTLELARLLEEIVVSGDRIGSAHADNPDALAREWHEYCQSIDLWPRAARSGVAPVMRSGGIRR